MKVFGTPFGSHHPQEVVRGWEGMGNCQGSCQRWLLWEKSSLSWVFCVAIFRTEGPGPTRPPTILRGMGSRSPSWCSSQGLLWILIGQGWGRGGGRCEGGGSVQYARHLAQPPRTHTYPLPGDSWPPVTRHAFQVFRMLADLPGKLPTPGSCHGIG